MHFTFLTQTAGLRISANKLKMSVVVIRDLAELERYVPAWEDLAAAALEPNVFYEPWMLIPALRSFGADKDWRVVLIFADGLSPWPEPPLLCGFFPLERSRRYRGLPVGALSLLRHVHCYLNTPLLRAECPHEALAAFFDWLAASSGDPPLLEFRTITGDGLFAQRLIDQFNDRTSCTFVSECFTRPLLLPMADGDTYLRAALSGKHLKRLRRLERRLSERGRLEYVALERGGDLNGWIERFLRLEASGWKGREGTALTCSEAGQAFFVSAATGAFLRDRLMMLALRLDGRPVAMLVNFLAGEGAFAFKSAFDEDYAHFSPGVLLEVEGIRRLHAMPGVQWMDYCTASNDFLFDRLCPDRRMIKTVLTATGGRLGDVVVAAMPLIKWLSRQFIWR